MNWDVLKHGHAARNYGHAHFAVILLFYQCTGDDFLVNSRWTKPHLCIDNLTNSATVDWMTVPGDLKSKTFRDVPALQEWFEIRLEMIVQR